MIISIQFDTDADVAAQIEGARRILIPPSLDDIDTGNPEDAGARDEAHTDGPDRESPSAGCFAVPVKAARKPRAANVAATMADVDAVRAVIHATGHPRGPTVEEIARATLYGNDLVHACLRSLKATATGKARGTRYALPPQAPDAGAQDAAPLANGGA